MNIGKIERIFTDELVVSHQYRDHRGDKITEDLLIHPYYREYKFEEGMEVKFQYANECYRHYPSSCVCKSLRTYALPVFEKEKNFMERLLGWARKK
tara:strand:+ start:844 stop:1131 length:288 start_codon:yes stop_codon:yes gene_type:complete